MCIADNFKMELFFRQYFFKYQPVAGIFAREPISMAGRQ